MDVDFVSVLQALGDASGWAVAVATLLIVLTGLWRGWVVPGYVYQREVERGDRAEGAVESATKTTEQAAAATKAATDTALTVATQLGRIERAVSRLEDEPRQ